MLSKISGRLQPNPHIGTNATVESAAIPTVGSDPKYPNSEKWAPYLRPNGNRATKRRRLWGKEWQVAFSCQLSVFSFQFQATAPGRAIKDQARRAQPWQTSQPRLGRGYESSAHSDVVDIQVSGRAEVRGRVLHSECKIVCRQGPE
jgi:hypothetical protein